MKQIKKEFRESFNALTNEELKSIRGGAWWEVRIVDDKIIWIYHPCDEKPG